MRDHDVNAFLVGEAFMRAPEPGAALHDLFFSAQHPDTALGMDSLFSVAESDPVFDHEEAKAAEARLRSEEHTSELQSLMRISYDVFCLKNKISKIMIYNITE